MAHTKQQEHIELEQRIAQWVAAGNQIKRCEPGETATDLGMTHDEWERKYVESRKSKRPEPERKRPQYRTPLPKDLLGRRFGSMVVVRCVRDIQIGAYAWVCKCDCGGESKPIPTNKLVNGIRKSCSAKCPMRNHARKSK